MAHTIEEKEEYFLYNATGLYTVQDVEELIKYFDKEMEKDPNARIFVDGSSITGYEQKALKLGFDRMEEGFPPGVKIAFVYKKSGYLYYIIRFVARAMERTGKLFDDPQEAKKWLLNKSS